jgi:hypothetical protein
MHMWKHYLEERETGMACWLNALTIVFGKSFISKSCPKKLDVQSK